MKILIANLGSTSFKYKLYDDPHSLNVVAQGQADRIGNPPSNWSLTVHGDAPGEAEGEADLPDHGAAIDLHLHELAKLGIDATAGASGGLDGIGFKAVHGGPLSGAMRVDDHVLSTMEQFSDVAPAHNPPYIAAMRAFAQRLPDVPQVAAFETAFHQTIPPHRQTYAIPAHWTQDMGIRRYGFHGASHRYIAEIMKQHAPQARRMISCHLGGSASICAIQDGQSIANSFGMTAQTGLPHATRVGDFDTFALLKLRAQGLELDAIFRMLGKQGGLAGISGLSGDWRELEEQAANGHEMAQRAIDVFIDSVVQYVGAYTALLGGLDALVFTGGIGQNSTLLRQRVTEHFGYLNLTLDTDANTQGPTGNDTDYPIHTDDSSVQLWVVQTNEEAIVARQTYQVITEQQASKSGAPQA